VFGRRKKPAKLGMRRRTSFAWSTVAFPPPTPVGPPVDQPGPDPVAELSPQPIAPPLPPEPVVAVAPAPPPPEPVMAVAPAQPPPEPSRAAPAVLTPDPPAALTPDPPPALRPMRPAAGTTRPKLPAVRLGFSDGTSLELDDSSGASLALREAAARLTGGVGVNRSG